MANDHYIFYDTASFSTSANTLHTLFQSAQGSGSTRTKQQTNWIGAGSLPSENSFTIQKIGVTYNDIYVEDDIQKLVDQTYLELFINNRTRFLAPLRTLIQANAYSGVIAQATAANEASFGLVGNGFMFNPVKELGPGISFKVEVWQEAALSAASNIAVLLEGIWTKPD